MTPQKYLEKFVLFSFNLEIGVLEQSEFEKRLFELKGTLNCKEISPSKLEIIDNLLSIYNARTKELFIRRCIISLSVFEKINSYYYDEDILIGNIKSSI